jgi:neprilysin
LVIIELRFSLCFFSLGWLRSQCVEWTNKKLGMAVGALFIRDNFNHESKETALEMIHTIREAFNELLADIHWMDDETRAVAKEKADAMNERIGYPDILTNSTELQKEYVNVSVVPFVSLCVICTQKVLPN